MKMVEEKTKSRGLGRGLSALFEDDEDFAPGGDVLETIENNTSGRITVGVEQLYPGASQPRAKFDEEALTQLAESISTHGLLSPLLVRADRAVPDRYEIIAGERRWRAAQKAQLHEVPVIILDIDDQEALEIALVENLQREDLSPIEEAKGYQRLIDEYGHSQQKLAEILGKSRPHITNMMRLLSLPEAVLKHLEEGDLTIGHARALLPSSDSEALAAEVIREGLSVRNTEKLVAEQIGRPEKTKGSAPTKKGLQKDADTLALENDLSSILGMRVVISPSNNKASGSIKIDYKTLDQFDEICGRLTKFPKAVDQKE